MAKRGPQPKTGSMEPPAYSLCEKVPDAPEWLSDIGKDEWAEKAIELFARGLLTGVALSSLAVYCDTYAAYQELAEFVREKGNTVRNGTQARPEVSLMTQKGKFMLALADKFGFTPSSQSRIAIVPKPTKDVDPLAAARADLAVSGTARPS